MSNPPKVPWRVKVGVGETRKAREIFRGQCTRWGHAQDAPGSTIEYSSMCDPARQRRATRLRMMRDSSYGVSSIRWCGGALRAVRCAARVTFLSRRGKCHFEPIARLSKTR